MRNYLSFMSNLGFHPTRLAVTHNDKQPGFFTPFGPHANMGIKKAFVTAIGMPVFSILAAPFYLCLAADSVIKSIASAVKHKQNESRAHLRNAVVLNLKIMVMPVFLVMESIKETTAMITRTTATVWSLGRTACKKPHTIQPK